MSALPESLRLILAGRAMSGKTQVMAAFVKENPQIRGEVTTIWRDGEVWREKTNGQFQRFPNTRPIHD